MAAAWCGATLIRDDASWGRIQPKPGEWRFEVYDPIRELLAEYGLEWAPILNFPPLWSRAADSRPRRKGGCHRPEYHDWARFVRGFAAHYRGKIRSVEIWNEPDHPGFANFSGEEYVELLKTAYREIKAVAPELSVLSGGVAGLQSEEQKRLFRQCAGEMQILSQEKGLELHLELDGISRLRPPSSVATQMRW